MMRRSVDLPQPDGPISETNSPFSIVRSIPSSAIVLALCELLADALELDDLVQADLRLDAHA